MSSTGPTSLPVTIHFAPGSHPPAAGTLRLRLLDVTYSDAPSVTLVERRFPFAPNSPLRFELPVSEVDPARTYSVTVHLDRHGDGRIRPGDYINTQRYAVLTFGHGAAVEVELHRVL